MLSSSELKRDASIVIHKYSKRYRSTHIEGVGCTSDGNSYEWNHHSSRNGHRPRPDLKQPQVLTEATGSSHLLYSSLNYSLLTKSLGLQCSTIQHQNLHTTFMYMWEVDTRGLHGLSCGKSAPKQQHHYA